MPATPKAADTPDTEAPANVPITSESRWGFAVPGLEFKDGEADHRKDLKEPEGSGGIVRDGQIKGVTLVEHPDRPELDPPVGPMWEQRLPEDQA